MKHFAWMAVAVGWLALAGQAPADSLSEAGKVADVAGTGAPATVGPRIEFDKTVYDFGSTSLVQSVTGTFTFHNRGDAELVIQKPSTTCGCTVAAVKPDKLAPGEKGELTFTLTIGNSRGRVQKFINVPSNDPSNANVRLTVQVEMHQVFEVKPQVMNFEKLRLGEAKELAATVKRTDGKPLKLTRAQASREGLSARIEPGTEPETAVVRVSLKAEGAARRLGDTVQIYAEEPASQPVAAIQVIAQIIGDVTIQPDRLFFGVGQVERLPAQHVEQALTRTVRITDTRKLPALELKNPVSTLKDLNVEVVTLEKGQAYMLVAKFPQPPKESETGTISVETNLASLPKVEVPVSVTVIQR